MLTLNLIRKLYISFVLKALQEPKSTQETVPQKKKKYPNQNSPPSQIQRLRVAPKTKRNLHC